jgi:hypothetical protein
MSLTAGAVKRVKVGFFAYFLRFILGSSFAVSGEEERIKNYLIGYFCIIL